MQRNERRMALINKYDFLEKLKISKYYNADDEYKSGFNDGVFHAEVTVEHLPEVDAIPVEFIADYVEQIECRNCAKWDRETERCFYGGWVKEPDDYCSWAVEKKG